MADNKSKTMSTEEAGRKGGEATARNHDKEFYEEIGQKGGEATAENHDKEFYQRIGEKGGEATSKNHDKEFYQEIGQLGELLRGEDGYDDDENDREFAQSEH
ncbi:KGG domain-containing protein, partial [Heyndrickxia sporothermodurans]